MFKHLQFAATMFGRGALTLTAGQLAVFGVVALAVVGGVAYYYTSGDGKPRRVVNYPQEIYLVHTDSYFLPNSKTWSNDFSVFGANRWAITKTRPDAQGQIYVNFGIRVLAHADQVYAFRSNQQFCPKVHALKLKLDKRAMQEYACE